MADYYKVSGTTNPHTDWTSGVVLERDDETGEVTKEVRFGVPTNELNEGDRKKLSDLGYTVERSSAKEADEVAVTGPAATVGTDVTGAAPVFGESEAPDQAGTSQGVSKSEKK